MRGLAEIREANERATETAFLRERIRKALGYLETVAPEDTAVMAAVLVLSGALEGITVETEDNQQ